MSGFQQYLQIKLGEKRLPAEALVVPRAPPGALGFRFIRSLKTKWTHRVFRVVLLRDDDQTFHSPPNITSLPPVSVYTAN